MELKNLIKRKKAQYNKFSPVYCKALKCNVIFNYHGFNHLHYDGRRHRRTTKDATSRLQLMEHAPCVIQNSNMVKVDCKIDEKTGKPIEYNELYYKIPVGRRYKKVVVVVRKKGNTGLYHFYGIRSNN